MATSPYGGFADLSPYRARVEQKYYEGTPAGKLAAAIQQSILQKNIQSSDPNSPENQLGLAIQQANLQRLQRPQVINTSGGALMEDPNSPTGFSIIPGTMPASKNYIETTAGMLEPIPGGGFKNVFPFTQTPTGPMQQVVNLDNPEDVRFARPDLEGKPPSGFQFSKAMEQPMKPSEKISATKDIRQAHDELQSKLLFFGKGQVPGAYGIKRKLDAVLQPVNFDFSKLNAQAKQSFVFAANKLRDPTSATLLTEAKQIADKAGVLDRFNAFVAGFKEGDPLPDNVAKDIYQVITQTHDLLKSDYLEDLPYFQQKLKILGEPLEAIGVPVSFSKELEKTGQQISGQVISPVATPGINSNAPSPVIPPGMKLQKSNLGNTRLVPQ